MAGKKDLNDFITHIRDIGLPTASHFQITLPGIIGVPGTVLNQNFEDICLLCDSVSMPGISLLTNEIRTMGEVSEMVYGITYPPVSFEFYLNNKFEAKKYFEAWSNLVFDRENRTIGYYRSYVADVIIEALDKQGKIIYAVQLLEAYPKSIGDLGFNNSSHDPLKLNIQLNYKYWIELTEEPKPKGQSLPSDILGGSFDLADNTTKFDTLAKTASDSFFNFDKADNTEILGSLGNISSVGAKLSQFGPEMGSTLQRAAKAVSANSLGLTAPGLPGFGSSFGSAIGSIGTSINLVGGAIGNIGKAIKNVTGPLAAIGGTVNSLSNSVGALDGVLRSVGINNTGLNKITRDLNKIGGEMNKVANLNGFPGKLGALGGSLSALGGSMDVIKKSLNQFPTATTQLKNSVGKLGDAMTKQGNQTASVASTTKSRLTNGHLDAFNFDQR